MENNGTAIADDKPIGLGEVINATNQNQASAPIVVVPDNKSDEGIINQEQVPPSSTTGKDDKGNNEIKDDANNQQVVETFEQTIIKLNNDATLSSEDKEYKTLLLETFKGTAIDEKGNLVDKDNTIVLSADKLKNYLENEELPFDDKGNVVNDKGEIIKSKEQVLLDNSVIIPTIKSIEEQFGIKLPNDFKTTENTEGIIEVLSESLKQVERKTVINFLDGNPELKAYAQHLHLGGTAENYTSSNIDYKNINIKTLEESAKLDLIKKSFTTQGNLNPDQLIEMIKKSGEEDINKATASAILFLDAKQTESNTARDAQIKQANIDQQIANNNYWKDVSTLVTKGTIGEIQIPITKRQAFFDYMSKPINDKGQSQEAIDVEKEGIENDLLLSYLRFNNGKIDVLAGQIARQQRVNTLQDKFNKLKGLSNTTGVPEKGNQNNNDGGNLSLEQLFPNRK